MNIGGVFFQRHRENSVYKIDNRRLFGHFFQALRIIIGHAHHVVIFIGLYEIGNGRIDRVV